MKKQVHILTTSTRLPLVLAGTLALASLLPAQATADYIETSASCSGGTGSTGCDSAAGGSDYGFVFRISDTVADSLSPTAPDHSGHGDTSKIFHATLLNTSSPSTTASDDPLIDLLAFNINATLGSDFTINNISPNWTFDAASGGGVQFDYLGENATPGDRIGPNEALIFDIEFSDSFALPADPFLVWTDTNSVGGSGIGGGQDIGQLAISFQALRDSTGATVANESDLLAGNWSRSGGGPPASVPLPAPLFLIAMGVLAVSWTARKQQS